MAALELDVARLFIGRELESLARVTAEVVCDERGAIDRINELVRLGWIKAPKADALAGSSSDAARATRSRPGTADGLRYASSGSSLIRSHASVHLYRLASISER